MVGGQGRVWRSRCQGALDCIDAATVRKIEARYRRVQLRYQEPSIKQGQ
jgi:hypothetical protein